MNRFMLAITVAFPQLLFYSPETSGKLALIPLLVMAGVAAAAAAAGGIANAVQNEKNLSAEERQALANRAQQQAIAQQQASSSRLQQDRAIEQDRMGGLMSALQQGQAAEHQSAARVQQASDDLQGSLSRAYLTRNSANFGGKQ